MAPRKYRVGVIGFAHMHIQALVKSFRELVDSIEWVACADTEPCDWNSSGEHGPRDEVRAKVMKEAKFQRTYADWRDLLANEKLDIAIVCSENALHGEICSAAAAHGAHVLTEKPMAHNLADALRMVRAAEAAGVKLVINWPATWSPSVRKAKELLDAGEIGRVLEVRWRNGRTMGPFSHGEEFTIEDLRRAWWYKRSLGGGALLDYCCYGAMLSRWYLGQPATAVTGLTANLLAHWGDAEDNAILSVRFPNAIALLEGSWTNYSVGVPGGPVIMGSEGVMVVNFPSNRHVSIFKEPSNKVHITPEVPSGFLAPTRLVECDPLPAGRDSIAKEMIHHIETGEPIHPTLSLEVNVDAMAILDAGIRSSQSGKMELVNSATFPL